MSIKAALVEVCRVCENYFLPLNTESINYDGCKRYSWIILDCLNLTLISTHMTIIYFIYQ